MRARRKTGGLIDLLLGDQVEALMLLCFASLSALITVIQGVLVLARLGAVVAGAAHPGMPAPDVRALAFSALVLTNLGLILVNRSFSSSLGSALLRPNRSLAVLALGIGALLAIGLYWAPSRALFHFGRPHWDDLALCVLIGTLSVVALEGLKTRWFRPQLHGGKAA